MSAAIRVFASWACIAATAVSTGRAQDAPGETPAQGEPAPAVAPEQLDLELPPPEEATAEAPSSADPAPAERAVPVPDTTVERSEQIYSTGVAYDPRSPTGDSMIAPADTVRLGFETTLVTADGDLTPLLGTPQLALTDLALLRASIGYSVAGKVELLAALTVLPKQPIATDAPVFQGGLVGARVGLASAWALTFTAQGGPTIDGDGGWLDGALTLDARYRADRYLVFAGHVGAGATAVSPAGELVGLSEVLAGGQVILQDPGDAAITTGIAFAFPFWSSDASSIRLDPETRVDVHVTGVLALADEWDVWLRGAVIDRGEITAHGSVLPILDGGFDQQQLTLGVSYRSEERDPDFAL